MSVQTDKFYSDLRANMPTTVSLPSAPFTEGEFRIGSVLNRTWSVLSRNFLTFFLVTGIADLPDVLFSNVGHSRVMTVIAVFVSGVMGRLSQAVVLYRAFQEMRGERVSIFRSFQVGWRRFLPNLGLAICAGLLTMLATALLVIPGVIVFLMLFVATPACVVERLGPFDSMDRSAQLTKGHRWKILGMLLLMGIPAVVIIVLFEGIAEVAGGGLILSAACELTWNAIVDAGYAMLVIATYHDLRVAKEGVDTAQIASVFE
jgi:hypothetical protein